MSIWMTIKDYFSPATEPRWTYDHANNEALMKLADQPMTDTVIPRRGPPVCPYCGGAIGKCVHSGGPA